MPVLMELGNLHSAATRDEAIDRSSGETKPIRSEFCAGFDIIISMLLTMKILEAEAKFGEKGMENRNRVDEPWVRTMVRTVPNRRASRGVARFATPITRLLTPPKMGPVTSFARPYLR